MDVMRFTSPRTGSNSAFTRTDLLSVLGVAFLLGLVLSPVWAISGGQAARTICRNNLRQLANASVLYAADNGEYMAYPNWGTGPAGWLYYTTNGNAPDPTTGVYAGNPLGAYRTGLWFEYVRNTNAYLCPTDLESPYYKARMNKLSSYVMNGAVCGYGMATTTARITDVWSPECYLLYQPDEAAGQPPIGAFAFNDGSSFPDRNEGMGALHSAATAEILTVGGNVQSVTKARVLKEQTTNGKSLAWWSPFSAGGR